MMERKRPEEAVDSKEVHAAYKLITDLDHFWIGITMEYDEDLAGRPHISIEEKQTLEQELLEMSRKCKSEAMRLRGMDK